MSFPLLYVIFAFVNCLKKIWHSFLAVCIHSRSFATYATIFFSFFAIYILNFKICISKFWTNPKKFRVRHLQNSSLRAEILKKITLNFKSALPVRKLCRGTSATSATPVPDLNEQWAACSVYYTLVAHWGYHYPILNVTVSAPSASGNYENDVIYRATWLAAQT